MSTTVPPNTRADAAELAIDFRYCEVLNDRVAVVVSTSGASRCARNASADNASGKLSLVAMPMLVGGGEENGRVLLGGERTSDEPVGEGVSAVG